MKIIFLPEYIEHEAQPGERLMDVAARSGVLIDGNCGSSGKCGKCRVRILAGSLPAPDGTEVAALSEKELRQGYRLACRLRITSDLRVHVPKINTARVRKTKLTGMPDADIFSPDLQKFFIDVPFASLESQKADLERILELIPAKDCVMDTDLIGRIPAVLAECGGKLTVTIVGNRIIELEAGDTSGKLYGIAFDIGTTTVVGMLWDMHSGRLLDIASRTNPQNTFGADVISRIESISRDHMNLTYLKERIRNCLNEIIGDLTDGGMIDAGDVRELAVVGNTTMSHLFLGVNPEQLARAPFVPVFCASQELRAGDIGLSAHPRAVVRLLSNIAGHVGSDITAAIMATSLAEGSECRILIDIGTNGEIVLSHGGRILACSTAAGPAFEGASIHQGMRASSGAIEGVLIKDGEVDLDVIDGQRPVGICGSGLMDAVAQMLGAGLLDDSGRLSAGENVSAALAARIREGEKGREFVLWQSYSEDETDIVVTQKDIREIQLAKAAIHAGIILLLRELDLGVDDIDNISLAGAFGNYIKKESALKIGLLPDIPAEKIHSVGNAAGTGASMALLSQEHRKKADILAGMVRHVELSAHIEFQSEFMKNMYFPKDGGAH